MVNIILTSSGLPKNMWGEALYFFCYILNIITKIVIKLLMSYGRKENLFKNILKCGSVLQRLIYHLIKN